jgi:RNA polymerase sigma-70 factor, ECF subfamily
MRALEPSSRPSQAAGASIRHELHQQVLGYVGRRVGSRHDAEDIAQEVMLRIHRHSADLVHVERTNAWMYRIAANAITDHYRRAARREVPSGYAQDVAGSAPACGEPDTGQLRQGLATCLPPLLERLSPSYRNALELIDLEGMSQTEAAPRLGLSVSGMKSRVQRARRRLKDLVTGCCTVQLDHAGAVSDYRRRPDGCGCDG